MSFALGKLLTSMQMHVALHGIFIGKRCIQPLKLSTQTPRHLEAQTPRRPDPDSENILRREVISQYNTLPFIVRCIAFRSAIRHSFYINIPNYTLSFIAMQY